MDTAPKLQRSLDNNGGGNDDELNDFNQKYSKYDGKPFNKEEMLLDKQITERNSKENKKIEFINVKDLDFSSQHEIANLTSVDAIEAFKIKNSKNWVIVNINPFGQANPDKPGEKPKRAQILHLEEHHSFPWDNKE